MLGAVGHQEPPRPERKGWIRVRCIGGPRPHFSFFQQRPPFTIALVAACDDTPYPYEPEDVMVWYLDLRGDEPVYNFVEETDGVR